MTRDCDDRHALPRDILRWTPPFCMYSNHGWSYSSLPNLSQTSAYRRRRPRRRLRLSLQLRLPRLSGWPRLPALPELPGRPRLPALPGPPRLSALQRRHALPRLSALQRRPGLPSLPGPPRLPTLPHLPRLPAVGPLPFAVLLVAGVAWYHFAFGGFIVRGSVFDSASGQPIVGARVWTGRVSAITAADGTYALDGVKPPEMIGIDAPGYHVQALRVTSPLEERSARLDPIGVDLEAVDADTGQPIAAAL